MSSSSLARQEIDELYEVVGEAGYTVLLCDSSGQSPSRIVVKMRLGKPVPILGNFGSGGVLVRGKWRATNGIGTVIARRAACQPFTEASISDPDTINLSLLWRAGVRGRWATDSSSLDVSAIDPELSETSARADWRASQCGRRRRDRGTIFFSREQFRREWIVAVSAAGRRRFQACCWRLTANQTHHIGAKPGRRATLPSCLDDPRRHPGRYQPVVDFSSETSTSSGASHRGDITARLPIAGKR